MKEYTHKINYDRLPNGKTLIVVEDDRGCISQATFGHEVNGTQVTVFARPNKPIEGDSGK